MLFIQVTRDYDDDERRTEDDDDGRLLNPLEENLRDDFLPMILFVTMKRLRLFSWLIREYHLATITTTRILLQRDDDLTTKSSSKLHNWPPIALSKAVETVRRNGPRLLHQPENQTQNSILFKIRLLIGVPVL